jgi:chaperonin GroES
MQIKPISNHILLEALAEEKTTKSGIVIPDTADKERPTRAKVVAVGPGKVNEKGAVAAMTVKVGDQVLFKKYGPDEIEIEGKKYLICTEEDVLAVVE